MRGKRTSKRIIWARITAVVLLLGITLASILPATINDFVTQEKSCTITESSVSTYYNGGTFPGSETFISVATNECGNLAINNSSKYGKTFDELNDEINRNKGKKIVVLVGYLNYGNNVDDVQDIKAIGE